MHFGKLHAEFLFGETYGTERPIHRWGSTIKVSKPD
jgi:hypothetical protein